MWILISIIFGIPYATTEYCTLVFLKDLLRVLVKVEVVIYDKFFGWLRTTTPYRFIANILWAALTWYREIWKINKIMLWLLFCWLVLPKLLFVLLYITVYLIVWWEGFSIIFLILFFVIFVAFIRRTTIFLKKIIKKGEISFAENYEDIARDVKAFLQLRKTLIFKVLTLTKKLKLSSGLSSFIVRLYIEVSDLLFFLVTRLYWFAIFCVIVYCIVKVSPLFVLALISAILFNWIVS